MERKNVSTIKVVDAPCGAGKTSWAIQHINENADENYVYCTPFLEEIARICEKCHLWGNGRFYEPTYADGTKIESFNRLLAECRDIVVTHTTFLNSTSETLELIRSGEYTLIMDEALDVVESFNSIQSVEDIPRQKVTKKDMSFLLNHNVIQIREDWSVLWNDEEYGDTLKFSEVERLAKLRRLYCVDNNFLVTVFPPEIFSCFKEVYILTYMFDGSLFKYYLDLFNLHYELRSITRATEQDYRIVDYSHVYDSNFRMRCKQLITICDNRRMNDYRKGALTKTWYDNCKKDGFNRLKNNLQNYFRRYLSEANASDGAIMWTCYKEYKDKLKGRGYTRARDLREEERRLPRKELEQKKQELDCFVSCNAKATNKFKERWALAYCIDMRFHPMIRKFFTQGNEDRENKGIRTINPDENLYSLSALIQWVFRSRIRDEHPIEIYIPSKRMRELFVAWLEDEI